MSDGTLKSVEFKGSKHFKPIDSTKSPWVNGVQFYNGTGSKFKMGNIYSKKFFGNFFFLKKMSQFKAWGPYNEIEPNKWEEIFDYIGENNFKLTLAITASWVDEKSNLIPFYDKFPIFFTKTNNKK